ncbi:SET domain-containing protein-lysine N-methyltransferase [Pleionea sp. CnH1-48]|uniref:SET domain-containing protein n=1 Tax=Pleionea sp. CnH1-48 TaxID=2954494 RepID=UPI002097AC9C
MLVREVCVVFGRGFDSTHRIGTWRSSRIFVILWRRYDYKDDVFGAVLKSLIKVKNSAVHGKGLFANGTIKKGTVIGVCETKKTKKTGMYTLWLDSGKVDVTCDLKYINHSKKPNVAYYEDLSVVALKNIRVDDELLHDYGEEWS